MLSGGQGGAVLEGVLHSDGLGGALVLHRGGVLHSHTPLASHQLAFTAITTWQLLGAPLQWLLAESGDWRVQLMALRSLPASLIGFQRQLFWNETLAVVHVVALDGHLTSTNTKPEEPEKAMRRS